MKVLFFHRWVGVHTGGTENHIKGLALGFARKGHDVHFLTLEGNELRNYEPLIHVMRVSKGWMESDFSYPFQDIRCHIYALLFLLRSFLRLLVLKLKGVNYDVVSVHFFTEAFLMRFIRRLFDWPYVFVLEGNVKIEMGGISTYLEAKEAKYANLQIAITKGIVNECHANYGYKPVYLPHGIDLKRFNTSVNGNDIRKKYAKKGEKLTLTVCRLEPRKDIPTLISAASLVCKKDPNTKFLIVGEGPEKEKIQKTINTFGLGDNVKMAGYVSDDKLPKYYTASDVFVLPTLAEWLGMVFQEAMSCGVPIIATADEETLNDCGIVVPSKRPDLLAEKILEILNNAKLQKEMADKGLAKAKAYAWDNLIPLYIEAYESVIKTEGS